MAGLSEVVEAEIRHLERMIARLEAGKEDPEDFRVYRLKNGIYGIRGRPEHHMIRIKLPIGRITPEGLRVLAEVAERYAENRLAHVTTRQAVQLHHVGGLRERRKLFSSSVSPLSDIHPHMH